MRCARWRAGCFWANVPSLSHKKDLAVLRCGIAATKASAPAGTQGRRLALDPHGFNAGTKRLTATVSILPRGWKRARPSFAIVAEAKASAPGGLEPKADA